MDFPVDPVRGDLEQIGPSLRESWNKGATTSARERAEAVARLKDKTEMASPSDQLFLLSCVCFPHCFHLDRWFMPFENV